MEALVAPAYGSDRVRYVQSVGKESRSGNRARAQIRGQERDYSRVRQKNPSLSHRERTRLGEQG